MLLHTVDHPTWAKEIYDAGKCFVKEAADASVAYVLAGRLQLAESGWLMVGVPNAFVRGIHAAMATPGIELPTSPTSGLLNAHISVMRPEEITAIGGADKITERGKQYRYTLGRMYSVKPDDASFAEVWFVKVHSPELQQLRRTYGLSSLPNDGKYEFHITVAVRRRGVLGRNDTAKT
jgi:hypothetical protein